MALVPVITLTLHDATVPDIQLVFQLVQDQLNRIAGAINQPPTGATASRPTSQLVVGQQFFDQTIGLPVWWNGSEWIDAVGTPS